MWLDQLREIFSRNPIPQEDRIWLREGMRRGFFQTPAERDYLDAHLKEQGVEMVLSVPEWDRQDRERNWIDLFSLSMEEAEKICAQKFPECGDDWEIVELRPSLFAVTSDESEEMHIIADQGKFLDHVRVSDADVITCHFDNTGVEQALVNIWEHLHESAGEDDDNLLTFLVPHPPQRRAVQWQALRDYAAEGRPLEWGDVAFVGSTPGPHEGQEVALLTVILTD